MIDVLDDDDEVISKKPSRYDVLKKAFYYDAIKCQLIRKRTGRPPSKRGKKGEDLGLGRKLSFKQSYVVYFLMTGHYPTSKETIHHRDGDKKNIAFQNLQLMTLTDYRAAYQTKNSIGKGFGVFKPKTAKKFYAKIVRNQKTIYLGSYETEQLARIAYMQAKLNTQQKAMRG